jgi:hypothetical protein
VNSLHNQAVKRTGDGIVVVARETAANNMVSPEAPADGGDMPGGSGKGADDAGTAEGGIEGSIDNSDGSSGRLQPDLDHDGGDLRITSVGAGTGVAQAIERRDYGFMIGVQWHPEYLPQVRSQRRLFDELVRCAILHRDAATDGG